MFSSLRPDFQAPKYNSPRTMLGTAIDRCCESRWSSDGSPLKKALTAFVSNSASPLIVIDLLASLLDGRHHLRQGLLVEEADELHQVLGRRALRLRERAGVLQNPETLLARQAFDTHQDLL